MFEVKNVIADEFVGNKDYVEKIIVSFEESDELSLLIEAKSGCFEKLGEDLKVFKDVVTFRLAEAYLATMTKEQFLDISNNENVLVVRENKKRCCGGCNCK